MTDDPSTIARLDAWKQAAYEELRLECGEKLTFRRWSKLFFKYYMGYLNASPEEYTGLVVGYITIVAVEAGVRYEVVEDAFRRATVTINGRARPSTDFQWLERKIPTTMQEALLTAGADEYRSLVTRYALTGISNGLFLSLPPRVYNKLLRSSKLPVLEAYASPFNHTLPEYCSLFDRDRVYGSLGRFEEYITRLDISARLCVNPPYVSSVVTVAVDRTLDYMRRVRGEFLFIAPVMPGEFDPYNRLKEYPGTAWAPLRAGTYTMYNYVHQSMIVAPMELLIFCNFGGSSVEYLNALLSELARGVSEIK